MPTYLGPRIDATILGTASLLALAAGDARGTAPERFTYASAVSVQHSLVGRWESADHAVRLHLRADETYECRVAGRDQIARGTYRVDSNRIVLRDDSGLTTPATRVDDGALDMAGHRLYR
ncbi:Atu4866 domain-containing protein [Mangrovihabitans endophyticus]|uniref:Uncharacterized protein n=1 Tax=Mangrovihabitans endophyticus TaxID=1751298 RepID=A0A8J3C213_9ACTN|nr:Atu4866 domain-containing protein [Mangrovihabitans endophyticus]GGK98272.1 hypothetical protein GCM10012284_35620 [Mangrovihabitans endophyticus]